MYKEQVCLYTSCWFVIIDFLTKNLLYSNNYILSKRLESSKLFLRELLKINILLTVTYDCNKLISCLIMIIFEEDFLHTYCISLAPSKFWLVIINNSFYTSLCCDYDTTVLWFFALFLFDTLVEYFLRYNFSQFL